jgi:succinate dehydrogenase / fumarate reductase cytochrome b subunit
LSSSDEEPTLNWLTAALRSSVGKKFVMGFTGLFLCLFLVVHLAGNLLLFAGAEAYNEYAHKLHSMGALLVASEVILFAAFGAHIYLAWVTTWENRAARQREYAVKQSKKDPGNIISAISAENTMFISGAIILAYLFLHLADFKFELTSSSDAAEPYDKAKLLLSESWRVVAYVAASLFVGYHVSHGFASAFQSLGLNYPKYNRWIKCASIAFAIAVGAGFALVALFGVGK